MNKRHLFSGLALLAIVVFGIGFWAPWIQANLVVKKLVLSGAELARQQSAALWLLPGIVIATGVFFLLYKLKERFIFQLVSTVFSAFSVLFMLLVRLQMNAQVSSFLGRVVRLDYQYGFYLCLVAIILLMLILGISWVFREGQPLTVAENNTENSPEIN